MARGRFISNDVMRDMKINALSDDTSRLAFTWLITTADVEGRTYGDPAMVRSMLFPRRTDITVERMEAYLQEWYDAGLINWYESGGDLWLEFPKFDKHQVNLRKDREPSSNIPPQKSGTMRGKHPADIRQIDGQMTGEVKLIEENVSKENISSTNVESGDIKPDRKPSERQTAVATLEQKFTELSKIPLPKRATEKDKKAGAARWWIPLANIWELCDKDTDRAGKLIEQAYRQMCTDKLTIAAPQSIEQVAVSIFSQNGNHTSDESIKGRKIYQ